MFAATRRATTGSRTSQPVAQTRRHAGEDARRGPDVGQEVPCVGAEGDRVRAGARAEEDEGRRPVHGRGDDRDAEAGPDRGEGLEVEETVDGRRRDGRGRGEDRHPLESARQVLGLRVAEGVLGIGRFLRDQ